MKYAIWNKKDTIITPSGAVYTADEWMNEYPVARLEHIKVVCSAGEVNGGFFATLGQMVDMYTGMGCDFSEAESDEDKLRAIEAFEIKMNTPDPNPAPTANERIAAALEFQNMMA